MQSCDRLYDTEIRKVICSANAIESPNAAPDARSAPAALLGRAGGTKVHVSGHRSPSRTRWAMRGKPTINAFAITSGARFPAAGAC
jgi:hypothetical protein